MKNARTVVITLLATSFIAAGCGDDEDTNSTSTPAATTQTTATEATTAATTPTETTSTPTTATTPGSADEAVTQAVEACKYGIDAQPTIYASLKSDLKDICDKAASGDAQAAADATKEVCTKIVEANVPAGSARDQALAACK